MSRRAEIMHLDARHIVAVALRACTVEARSESDFVGPRQIRQHRPVDVAVRRGKAQGAPAQPIGEILRAALDFLATPLRRKAREVRMRDPVATELDARTREL